MVKSERYTCEICNKLYSSASSIWNHRTKIHKQTDNPSIISNNPLIIPDNPLIISPPLEISIVKTYDCKHCKKQFPYFQNRWRHEKICKNKNSEIIQNNNQIIQNQNNSPINNGTITTNNGTINTNNGTINTTNNIIINNYGQENIDYLKDELIKNTLIRLSKNDDESLKIGIPRVAQYIHFNKFHKENNNLEINSIKSKTAKTYIDGKWKYVKKDDVLKQVHNKIVELLQKWVDSHKLEISKAMMNGLKDYKSVNPAYIKRMILEEINLLGFVYYKNYMENDGEML